MKMKRHFLTPHTFFKIIRKIKSKIKKRKRKEELVDFSV